MFNTKLDVDKHVENHLKKINSELERNLRCFGFAKMYFKVGDYEQARRYVTIYLNAKPTSAEAQQLLGRTLEKLGKIDAALEAYRTSLDLDPKQNNLVLKVCELLASDNISFDHSGARYYCEKAESIDPHNPSIFSLKEKLILADGKDPSDVSKLLLKELEMRPCDANIRIRLLRHFLQNNQLKEAYEHVRDIEQKNISLFTIKLNWYETVAEVLIKYQHNALKKDLNWEFWILLISVLDKLVELSLDESADNIKTNNEYINTVFNFDQSLKIAAENIQDCPDKNLIQEFLTHYRGQLCLHLVTLIYKQAKKEFIKYKEAAQITLPLLFLSYHHQPVDLQSLWISHTTENYKQLVQRWNREASFRCCQTGHMLLSIAKDRKTSVLEKAAQCSSGLWREQLLKRIFVMRDHQVKIKSSYFATCSQFIDMVMRLPDVDEVLKYDAVAQLVHPNSIHYYIWIGLNETLSKFKCTVYEGLPYSVKNLNNCSAESLNVLDIQAFLYCAMICAQQQIEDQKHNIYYTNDKPHVVPAAVTNRLGTLSQSKWLIAAYKMFTNDYGCDFSEVRLTLIKGIEIVRCVGNHGLDVKILVTLAKLFSERSKGLEKQSEIDQNDARAELYWKTALPLLEKLKNNQTISYSCSRLFDWKPKEMPLSEIQTYIEDGKLFNAVQFMKKKEHERALALFESLRDPYASFYQAQIYKMKAEEQTSRNKESVTSEMRSQNIILLSRARDCLYLTFDRLRDPSVDRRHPLNSQLGTEIDKIERMLSRIDPDTCLNRNECDGMSDENMSSIGSMGDHFNYTYGNSSFPNGNITPKNYHLNSTPLRLDTSRREARPSPERLDAQLRQLLASKDTAVNHISEQMKFMMDSHRSLFDEIRGFKDAVNNLSSTVDDMKGFKSTVNEIKGLQKSVDDLKNSVDDLKNITDDVCRMKKEIAELKKDNLKIKSNQISDEDLYGLDEEYATDYNTAINSNVSGLPTNLYPPLGRLPPTNSLPYGPTLYPNMYPMLHYPGLGLPPAGSLPYGPESQITDFRAINSLSQGLAQSAAYLQPGFSQTGLSQGLTSASLPQGLTPGSLQQGLASGNLPQGLTSGSLTQGLTSGNLPQGLSHGGLPQTVLPPTGLTQNTLVQSSLGQLSHTNLVHGQPIISNSSMFSTISATSIPSQSIFSTVSAHIPSTMVSTNVPSFLSTTITSVRAPPVNVVITSSDPLPSTKSAPQPVLSVTIPPQHLKGGQQKSQPHNYQIQLPMSTGVTTPSVISQPLMPISTQGLLSNIAPPIYSAIDKTPQLNLSLGLNTEKSLNQSFGSSKSDVNKSNASADDHDPCPDFKPIIPLPDEVPVNTGEENETVLFEERAKLFRYANKEWRERGVGVLKLLKDVTSGKVRLLMRRDQVHKICANHFLNKGMALTPMTNNDKAYIWAANDFADQSIVLEKLCVRFKTPDIAQKFYKAFEDAKKNLSDPNVEDSEKIKDIEYKEHVSKENVGINVEKTDNSTAVTSLGGFVFTSTPSFKPKSTSPVNNGPPPNEIIKPSPFASFNFFKSPTTIPSTVAFSPIITDFKPVQNINDRSADVIPQKLETVHDNSTKAAENDDSHVEEYESTADFKPIIPLPDLVEIKTGEENAEVLFEQKAKLLRYDATNREWKERGIGQMKVLKYDNMIRLVMRREQIHKVCCNHQLLKSVTFSNMPKTTKVLCWHAHDFSEGVLASEMFAIKFKTEEQTKLFLTTVTSAQATLDENSFIVNEGTKLESSFTESKKTDKKVKPDNEIKKAEVSPSTKQSGWGDKYKPKSGSWECKNCYVVNEGKTSLCVACDTPKIDSAAKKQSGSGSQLSFGLKDQGVGNSSTFPFSQSTETKENVKLESENNTGWGNAFKPPADSWECNACFVRNIKDSDYCISCSSPRNDTILKKDSNKGINLETPGFSFNFGIPNSTTTNPTSTSDSKTVSFFEIPVSKSLTTNTFSFGSPLPAKQFTFSVKGDKKDDDAQDASKFVFGSPQKHTFDFTPRSPRRHSSGQGEEESEGSYVEEEEDNIYFKPVVPLPDKVEVKTGEEQEVVIYCHRAKLFRFADGEWKERGIGDIKILKQTDSGKLRVVMRREQVLKICLNHILTNEINYKQKDSKTWLFSAPDYSEGEIQHKQFCIRFKNGEVAKNFKKVIDDALSGSADETKSEDSDIEIIFETKVTLEEEEEAIKLGLPPKFMAYRQLSDCTCENCKKEDILLKDILTPGSSKQIFAPTKKSDESTFGTPQGSSMYDTAKSDSTFDSPMNDKYKTSEFTSTPEINTNTGTLKELLSKPSLFSTVQSNIVTSATFSSPALVSNVNKSALSEKSAPTSTASISNFSFTLKSENQMTFSDIFANKANPPSATSAFNTPPTPNLFNTSNVSKSGSLFETTNITGVFSNTSTGGNIFGGSNTQPSGIGNLFAGNKSAVSSEKSIFGNEMPTSTSIFPPKISTDNVTFNDTPKTVEKDFISTVTTTSNSIRITSPTNLTISDTNTNKNSIKFTPPAFGSNIFGNLQTSKTNSSQSTTIFGNSQTNLLGNSPATLTFGSTPSQAPLDCTVNNSKLEEKKFNDFLLKCDPNLSFASLAKESEGPPAFSKTAEDVDKVPFAFLGAGAPVFNTRKSEPAKDRKGAEEEAEGEEEYDPHYEPVIPLPEAVVSSTGEEDEAILFNERTKLFRYDVALREWKERGVGQFKILHHPVNDTYRMLLRREQVHKVVLNQLITTDLDLQPMSTTDKAWCWGGYNYSEDEHQLEKLAARFKNTELSKNFYDTIQNCILAIKESQLTQKLIPSTLEEYATEDVSADDGRDTGEDVEEEEEDLDYYDDDDEDERTLLFKERCTLNEQVSGGKWEPIATGTITMFYDSEIYGNRISFSDEYNSVLSSTLIGVNTVMNISGNMCAWRAVEWENNLYHWRNLQAIFETDDIAERFHLNYQEGLSYAEQSDIVDNIPTYLDPE